MKTIAFWGGLVLTSITTAFAGDTYACINSPGDYINLGPAAPSGRIEIVVAVDSARYEQRWQPMLSPDDLRRLIFIQARNDSTDLRIHVNP